MMEQIWKWRREILHDKTGAWVADVCRKISDKMSEFSPENWMGGESVPESKELARCYVEIIRIAGGYLNERPDLVMAQRIYDLTWRYAADFKNSTMDISDENILKKELWAVIVYAKSLANETLSRLQNIRSFGGF